MLLLEWMDYIKKYRNFVYSRYLTEGLRITAGVALPAIVLNYFNLLPAGIVVSLGALCVSVTDNAGPIHHRRNGMIACVIIIFIVALLTGIAAPHPFLLGILIFISCFVFTMMGVYGARTNSIGIAALLVMVLNIDRQHEGGDNLINAAYILAGGVWYMFLSLLLYTFRPYKLAQQELGDCILATADYMRIRASFYDDNANYERTYHQMVEQQVVVHEKQNLVRELLFKSRNIVKESTITGRTLVMIFIDVIDLFERAMTSYQDYKTLHEYFPENNILQQFQQLILQLAKELDEIGIAVKSVKRSEESDELSNLLKKVKEEYNSFRDKKRTPDNIEFFINSKRILESIEDISRRIHTLHLYTAYDKGLSKKGSFDPDYDKFIEHQHIDLKLLKDNLTLYSNTFRHALRVSVATIAGYIVSKFFPVGHGYWILLTIIVILKPTYSLSKRRNYERLLGTIGGALIGILILYFIKDNTVLFVFMLLLMIGTYTFLRTNYLLSVILMTPYILLLFHLLNKSNFSTITYDRLIDTGIGSVIAFLANFFLVPAWEQEQIGNYMALAIDDNINYFKDISAAYVGNPVTITDYKLKRKNAFVSLANLSDAFTRMLSEPKSRQKNKKLIHQFVVLSHMLTSHIATLSYYLKPFAERYTSHDFLSIISNTIGQLEDAKKIIIEVHADIPENTIQRHSLNRRVQSLMEKRRDELQRGLTDTITRETLSEFKSIVDQFNFISNIAFDIKKACSQLKEE